MKKITFSSLVLGAIFFSLGAESAAAQNSVGTPTPRPTSTPSPKVTASPTATPRPSPTATPTHVSSAACIALQNSQLSISESVASGAITAAEQVISFAGSGPTIDFAHMSDETLCSTALGMDWVLLLTSGRERELLPPLEDPFWGAGPPRVFIPNIPEPSFAERLSDAINGYLDKITRFPTWFEWYLRQLLDELRRRGLLR